MANDPNDFVKLSGDKPVPSTDPLNPSYTSADGRKIYLQFDDIDSTGLSPSTGTHLRFSVTKINAGSAVTVTPSSTSIITSNPKQLILNLSAGNKIVDGFYNGAGVVTSFQQVYVSYNAVGYGATVPLLGDDDTTRSLVDSFSGFGISNRTEEANGPVFLYAFSSYDGYKITSVFREATPSLSPYTGISGFAVTQNGNNFTINNAYVLDPSSAIDGKKVVVELADQLSISDAITISYVVPSTSPKLTDSTSLRNVTVAFAGAAVTNLVEETTKPTIISAETNTGGIGRTVFVMMSELTNPNSPSGFDVRINNLTRTFSATAGTTSYLSSIVTQYSLGIGTTFNVEDILSLNYTKPTSNFIIDRSNNQNPLDSLTDPISVSNLLTDTTAPSLVSGESYVDRNGLDIYAKFSENASVPLLPTSNISGFRIEINGVFSGVRSASSLNTSITNDTVKITLYNKIHKNDVVKIAYIKDNPTTANSLRDTSGNYVESFQPVLITNRTLDNTFGFFDPLEWESDINYNLSGLGNTTFSAIGTSAGFFASYTDLFSKEERYPGASVILDTHPPYGTVIINRNANASDAGIKIHEFGAFGKVIDYSNFSDYTIANLLQGWQYISDADQTLSQVSFKLKKTGTISNSGDVIEFLLFSGDEPGTLIGKLGQIIYGDLTDSYQTFSFAPTDIKLSGSTSYWFVISVSTLPISNSGSVNVFTAQISKQDGIIAYYNSTTGKWVKTLNSSGYVKISASNIEGDPLSGRDIMLDILENPIRDANSFGGSNEKEFEVIGDTQFNYILKKLNKITDTTGAKVYPEVTNIVIGATSAVPKNFSVEVKTTPTSEWLPVFDTISDEDTLEFLNYKFDTPQRLCQIRLSYRGDYFTLDQAGELTLAAKDDLSNVVSAQISHFPDFRDSVDFENADVRGFIDFREGVTEYSNFSITNSADILAGQTTYGSSEILASINFGSKVIVACNNKIFVYGSNEIKTVSNNVFLEPEDQINCFAVYKNKVYCGTSNGLIYSSYNGEFWTLVNSINPLSNAQPKYIKPVLTMSVLGKYLYIGTSKGTTSQASIYTYDGKSILKISDFDFDAVSASASFANLIFFGLSDGYAVNNSAIYKYNGLEFTRTLATDFDSVDSLCYSSSKKAMIAGFRGGEIWELPYNSNNDPLSWALAYSTYADRIYSIVDDTAGSYTYIATDNGLFGYFKSLDQFKSITSYNYYTPNLNVIYRDYPTYALSKSEDKADIESNDQILYDIQIDNVNYNNYSTEIPSSFTNTSIEIEGAIKAESSTTYSFRLETNMGIKMYLNDSLVVDEYTEQTSDQIYDAGQTFTVRNGEFIKIKIKAFVSTSTTPSFRLLWNDENLPEDYTIIPSSQYFRSNRIKSVHNFLTNFVGCGSDGNVYSFDPSFYETKIRRVYVRFKDEAGNIHGIVLPGKTAPYPIIQDKITQDLKTKNGAKVSSGKIFQVKQNSNYILSTRSVYTPRLSNYSIYAPDRKVRATGIWEVQPFYIPSLSQWGNLTALILNKYGLNDLEGLDSGTEVKIYVRSGSSRESVLSSDYSNPFVSSYINNSNTPTTASTFQVPLQTFGGKWLQYKVELISATQNLSPEVLSVTVNYTAATGSYFFTKMFNAADYSIDPTAPSFRRGLLTSNDLPNGGTITYGYTTDDTLGNTFDFSKFTEITLNKTFDLSSPSSKVRFGIMFTAVGAYPSVVYDFAVQLDAGPADLKMMPGL